MSKLRKVNSNGTLSVILPKTITENVWAENDEVSIENIGTDAILILRNDDSCNLTKQALFEWCDELGNVANHIKSILKTIKQVETTQKTFKCDDNSFRKMFKESLIYMIRKL